MDPRPEITETVPTQIVFTDGVEVTVDLPTPAAAKAWSDYVWDVMREMDPDQADNIDRARAEQECLAERWYEIENGGY